MQFEEAIKHMKAGERIKRSNWKSAYLQIVNKKIMMSMGFRKPWFYNFRHHDIFADDWLIETRFECADDEYANLKPLTGKLNFR